MSRSSEAQLGRGRRTHEHGARPCLGVQLVDPRHGGEVGGRI